eukprot:GEZU01025880.1.p1 GENE.GEZU01025880.1~~GEZU01025880.1.p1  ORF type:complete len:906 (+),score=220.47 GEZU01025880.1:72-2720(+)
MRRKTICTIPSSKSPRDNPYTEDDVAVADDCSIKKSFRRLSALYESKRRRRRRKGSACCIPTSADHHTRCFHCNSIIVATSTPITTTTTTAAEDAHSFEELVAQSTRRRSMREQQEEISRQIKLEADRKAEQERIQLQLSLQRKHDELMAQREERRRKRRMIEEELMREQEESKLVYQGASPTANEEKRLAALHRMNILDTPFDENFDRLTNLCKAIFGCKIAIISLVDEHRHWFKSVVGFEEGLRYSCRNISFCSFTIKQTSTLVVPDTLKDPRFATNPLVLGGPKIRFYAGAPLQTSDGFNLGAFCILDVEPREDFDETKQRLLMEMAKLAVREMELYKASQMHFISHERERVMARLCQDAVRNNSLDYVFDRMVTFLAELLSVDYVHILEFTPNQKQALLKAGFGWDESSCTKGSVLEMDDLVSGTQVVQQYNGSRAEVSTSRSTTSTPSISLLVIDHFEEEHDVLLSIGIPQRQTQRQTQHSETESVSKVQLSEVLQQHGIKSGICVMIYHRDTPFGLLGVYDDYRHAWHDEDVMFLKSCGRRLSFMIERIFHAQQLAHERKRVDDLLYNVLPAPISDRLKSNETPIADAHSSATVLFADIVGFTELSTKVSPKQLVEFLNRIFTAFDIIAIRSNIEKVKTIGDCYMVAGGLFSHEDDHAEAVVQFGCDIMDELERITNEFPANSPFKKIKVRIGINTGPIVAGVIGVHKYLYDIWGDAVNTASRFESSGVPGKIQISESTLCNLTAAIQENKFEVEYRGTVFLKGKGPAKAFFVKRGAAGTTVAAAAEATVPSVVPLPVVQPPAEARTEEEVDTGDETPDDERGTTMATDVLVSPPIEEEEAPPMPIYAPTKTSLDIMEKMLTKLYSRWRRKNAHKT